MTTITNEEENVLHLPGKALHESRYFAIDIGSSLAKLCYIPKEEWLKEKHRKDSKLQVKLISFPKDKLDDALQIIKQNRPENDHDQCEIIITGTRVEQFKEYIGQLNIRSRVVDDTDSFVHALFCLVKNQPKREFLHDICKPAFKFAREQAIQAHAVNAAIKEEDTPGLLLNRQPEDFTMAQETESGQHLDKPLAETTKDLYPFGLVICGSGILFTLVHEDGTYEILHNSTRAGCTFMGLGRLLTQAKTYDELMSLAERGNASAVDLTIAGMNKKFEQKKDEECVYQRTRNYDEEIADDRVVYSFGLAAEKEPEEFQKADLAQCLLRNIIDSTVQNCLSCARVRDLRHVFFSGGFVDHPFVRKMLTLAWLKRDTQYKSISPKQTSLTQVHFPQHSSYLAAIGALVHTE